jgi:hypothetical protein
MTVRETQNAPEFKHATDMEWEMGRFGNVTKFLFHPRPERPTLRSGTSSRAHSVLLESSTALAQ